VFDTRSRAGKHPWLAIPLARALAEGAVIDATTDVVIEGFPSCGNSFAVAAFLMAQEPTPCRVAHHTHMSAQVIVAARRSVPTMVLIRPARDAVVSLLARSKSLRAGTAVRGYIRFYERLLPLSDRFVVGSFTEVVKSFDAPIRRLNDRFGTSFVPFGNTADEIERIHALMLAHERRRGRHPDEIERTIPRPSAARDALKSQRAAEYEGLSPALRDRADVIYGRYESLAR
jgi:hypothetical protein